MSPISSAILPEKTSSFPRDLGLHYLIFTWQAILFRLTFRILMT